MKSHPLVEAARVAFAPLRRNAVEAVCAVRCTDQYGRTVPSPSNVGIYCTGDEWRAFCRAMDALGGTEQEPLTIVPCAWLVEAADACDALAAEMVSSEAETKWYSLAAKLRGAVGG